MEHLTTAFNTYAAQVRALPTQTIEVPLIGLPVNVFILLLALGNAYFLRHAIRYDVHILRLIFVTMALTLGGGSMLAIIHGNALPLLAPGAGHISAVLLAVFIVFFIPNGYGAKFVGLQQTRPLWQAVGALNIANGVLNGLALSDNKTTTLVKLFLCIIGATGGQIIGEYTNILLLSNDAYKEPIGAPSAGAIYAVLAGLIRLALTNALLPAAVNVLIPKYLSDNSDVIIMTLLMILNVSMTPIKLQSTYASLTSYVSKSLSVIEPLDVTEDEMEGDLPWPLNDGLFGYDVTGDVYDGDDNFPSFFWPSEDDDEEIDENFDDEDEEEEEEEEAPAPKAKSPALKAVSAKKGKAAASKAAEKAASPAPAKRARAASRK
jgi:hypothetical protein